MTQSFSLASAKLIGLLLAVLAPFSVAHAQSNFATPYTFTVFTGTTGVTGTADGTGTAAQFWYPSGVAADGAGNVYVACNFTIRKITPVGVVSTFAGSPGQQGFADGTGSAARFYGPQALTVDAAGNIFVSDSAANTIRKITPAGVVTTLAGSPPQVGNADGTGAAARFWGPAGIAVDASGNVFVVDSGNNTIRKITPAGIVTTFAGSPVIDGHADGTGGAASFYAPNGLAIDGSGNLYVADEGNRTIRKITPGAVVTTFAGLAGSAGFTDGPGSVARFYRPNGLALDGAANLYVVDDQACSIRKVTPAGVVTTLAGSPGTSGAANGTGSNARFQFPEGIAVDAAGALYVADSNNQTIRKGVAVGPNDFNGNGQADILWQNTSTGDRGFWLMNGSAFASWVDVGVIPSDWRIAATGDFNGDGQADILWENTATGDRGFWLMNGTTFASWVDIGIVSTDWRIAAVADFNGDCQPDIVWENTVMGDRYVWFLNGTSVTGAQFLGNVGTNWHIAAAADFNGDGHPDLLWENTVSGGRYFWFLNDTSVIGAQSLGNVSTDWHIATVVDFNGDGKPDILWENTVTGDRYFWFLDGTTVISATYLGTVSTDWHIAN